MFRTSEPTSPLLPLMCRTRKSTSASNPSPSPSPSPSHHHHHHHHHNSTSSTSSTSLPSFTHPPPPTPTTSTSTTSTSLDSSSLSSLRFSLSENPVLYPFSELSAATNNFLSKRLTSSTSSSTSSSWKCTLRGKEVVVFQRNFRGDPSGIPSRLSALCRGHHSSIARLLGASLPSSASADNIYLVYEHVAGASLQSCLRNPRNPNFTPLSKWISRIKIAADIAQGLEYMHIHCRTIHNRIKSSAVVVTDPDLGAKICHFGAADLAGEVPPAEEKEKGRGPGRSNSRRMRIEGTRGYIAPEVISGAAISMRSDVYAFGVVILELVSGKEPVKYVVAEGDYRRVSVIESAREAIGTEDEDGAAEAESEERRGRVRRWVDRRLRDSFPVEAAERLIRVALRCVEEEAWMRPEMTWVAGKVSKLYLDSRAWAEKMTLPTDFSVSLAPR